MATTAVLSRKNNLVVAAAWGFMLLASILPEIILIELDYFVPFTPDQKNGMWVKAFQEFEYILWWDKKDRATWLWVLVAAPDNQTRLVTRLRTTYDFRFPWIIYYLLYDIGDIVMMSKCLLGIKERVEALGHKLALSSPETS